MLTFPFSLRRQNPEHIILQDNKEGASNGVWIHKPLQGEIPVDP